MTTVLLLLLIWFIFDNALLRARLQAQKELNRALEQRDQSRSRLQDAMERRIETMKDILALRDNLIGMLRAKLEESGR